MILALDVDCFYAQAEVLRDPSLVGKAVGVQQKHIVITTTYEAREFGIEKGESADVVRRKCPEIVLKNGEDLSYYVSLSEKWRSFVESFAGGCSVERLGLDELFVDITSLVEPSTETIVGHFIDGDDYERQTELLLRGGAKFCDCLRQAVKKELGLTTSGGIATTKILAKLASSVHKPFAQTTVFGVRNLIKDDQLLRSIPGIGAAKALELKRNFQLETVGDCRNCHDKDVDNVRRLCFGDDNNCPVKASSLLPKSIGVEDSFWQNPISSLKDLDLAISALADKLETKLLVFAENLPTFADAIVIGLRFKGDGPRTSRQRSTPLSLRETKMKKTDILLRKRLANVAKDLILEELDKKRILLEQKPIVNLSLGLKLPTPDRTIGRRIEAFLSTTTQRTKINTLPQKNNKGYEAPMAEDLDEDVINALPADIQAELRGQRQLAKRACSKKPTSSFFLSSSSSQEPKRKQQRLMFREEAAEAVVLSDDHVATITAMGFARERARSALERHGNSVTRALEELLNT